MASPTVSWEGWRGPYQSELPYNNKQVAVRGGHLWFHGGTAYVISLLNATHVKLGLPVRVRWLAQG